VFTDVANNDYKGFYKRSMSERSRFAYPPYTKLVKIQVKHKDEPLAMRSAFYLANLLRQTFGGGVLGPEPPVISKLQNFYIQEILLKISKKYYGSTAKKIIMENINSTKAVAEKSGLIISVNVDPM
jgi:primosomal protein N' (replication factor Y)